MALFTAHRGRQDGSSGSALCVTERERKHGGTDNPREQEYMHVHMKVTRTFIQVMKA